MKGVLEADFSSFVTACKTAEVSLDGLEKSSKTVTKSLNTAAESFSGGKIIQQAQIAVRAVDDIGGVTKLTQKEQQKLNGLVTEAIAKYDALGKEAPADMRALADQTKGAADQMKAAQGANGIGGMTAGLKTLAGAAGLAFSVEGAIAFGKHIVSNAAAIKDQAEALGVSIEGFQKFKAAAEEGGATIDDVGKAINTMNKNIDEGNKSTVDGLKALGLSYQDVSRLSPEDAFLAITDALQKIQDPMLQARVGSDLLGTSFVKLAPAVKDGVREVGNAATIMSEQTVRDLAEAEAAWGKLANWVTIKSGTILAETMKAAEGATKSWQGFFTFIAHQAAGGAVGGQIRDALGMDPWFSAPAKPFSMAPVAAHGGAPAKKTQEELAAEAKALATATAKAEAHTAAIKALADAYRGATAITAARNALEAFTQAQRAGLDVSEMSADQLASLNRTMLDAIAVHQRMGTTAPPAWLALAQATTSATLQGKLDVTSYIQVLEKLKDVTLSLPALSKAIVPSLDVTRGLGALIPGTALGPLTSPKGAGLLDQLLGDPAQFGAKISSAIAGAIQGGGNIAGAAAGAAGSSIGTNIAGKLSKSLLDEGSGLFSKALGGVISSALPIVGSLIGPLAEALWGKLFGKKGRDAVVAFADSLGGFDALHVQLNALGAEGEQLWIKLTQGTGRNNPEQAAKNIKLVEDALAAYTSKQADAAKAAEQAAETQIAATNKVRDAMQATVDDLDAQMQSLQQSIANEAPEEFMGIVEAQARERIESLAAERAAAQAELDDMITESAAKTDEGLDQVSDGLKGNADDWRTWADQASGEIDRVTSKLDGLAAPGAPSGTPGVGATVPSFASGTGGQYLNFGRGTLAMLHGRERVSRPGEDGGGGGGGTAIIQIDGRTLAEIVVPAMPGVITRYGLGRG